jgi:hypothetical protein
VGFRIFTFDALNLNNFRHAGRSSIAAHAIFTRNSGNLAAAVARLHCSFPSRVIDLFPRAICDSGGPLRAIEHFGQHVMAGPVRRRWWRFRSYGTG